MAERQAATWRGVPAWRIATDEVAAVVCPSRGAKIASLLDVRNGRELLRGPDPAIALRPLTYGALWSAYETCGWDEVFPTLGECDHPGPGRSTGVRLPDHGEVWSLAWTDETPDDAADVVCSVAGVALPYLLRRTVSVDGAALRLDYALHNTGEDPLPYQWLPHPLLVDPAALLLSSTLPWTLAIDGGVEVPATADGPDLATAVEAGRALVLAPGHVAQWSVTATLRALFR